MKAYTFSDVLIKPKYSEIISRSDVSLAVSFEKYGISLKLPVISANMKTITGPNMAITMARHGGLGILHRFNTIEEAVKDFNEVQIVNGFLAGVSVGVKDTDRIRFRSLYNAGARIFCIDVAHGHHILVKNMIKWIKQQATDVLLIAGNIATAEGFEDLSVWGADIIKCGIGPSPVCATRSRTGVGVPQLYALEKIAEQRNHQKIPSKIISDGGIACVGDIAKALKFADMVMVGSFIAGTSETPGNVFKNDAGQFYKVYGGSASAENKGENKFVEGVMKTVQFKGKVKYILQEIDEGLRSAFSYVGAENLNEYQQKCEFEFITSGGSKESKF